MLKKAKRKLGMLLALGLLLALTLPMAAQAGEDNRAAMDAYWRIMGDPAGTDPLSRAMNGEAVPLSELTAVTAEELMAFAAGNSLPIDMARCGWYAAIAQALRSNPDQLKADADTRTMLELFLSMPETHRDRAANDQRRDIRRGVTLADVEAISAETGLPGGFVAWLLLEDDWYEGDWEDVDDWREGRSSWVFADHAYEKELREAYGKSAVVDDDEVERVLRQNGVRYDD